MSEDTTATHAIIRGRVQGVCYRAWTVKKAQALGLTGWVRNCKEGSVEAVFCGSRKNVDTMIKACHSGPTLARVDNIETAIAENEGWDAFYQRSTV